MLGVTFSKYNLMLGVQLSNLYADFGTSFLIFGKTRLLKIVLLTKSGADAVKIGNLIMASNNSSSREAVDSLLISPIESRHPSAVTDSEVGMELDLVKKNDVYFKIWNKLEDRNRISTVTKVKSETSELDKCVAEFANNDGPRDYMGRQKNKSNVTEGPGNLQISANTSTGKKRKSLNKGNNSYIEEQERPDPKDDLEQMAMNEILKEAKRGAERSTTMGPAGWLKPNTTTNKRFLTNTLMSTLQRPFTNKDTAQYKEDTIKLHYGIKGSHWGKEEKSLTATRTTEGGKRKHDFYCYYLPENVMERKLKKRKKDDSYGTNNTNSLENKYCSDVSMDPTSKLTTETKPGMESPKKDNKETSEALSLSVENVSTSESESHQRKHTKKKKKHHKHRKSKKNKNETVFSVDSSCSVDITHAKKSLSDDPHRKKHKKHKKHKHKRDHRDHQIESKSESECSWDEWDATNYREGWEVTRHRAKKRKHSSLD